MLRLIIIFFIIALFSMLWRLIKLIAPIFSISTKNNQSNNQKNNIKNSIKNLTKCTTCNLYIPMEDAVYYNSKVFCCKEHANQDRST